SGTRLPASVTQPSCPHCGCSVPLSDPATLELTCPTCGSTFRLERGEAAVPPTAQSRLDRFELLEVVGRGAFGVVYRARDRELDPTVALKMPRAGTLTEPGDVDRFLREARSAARLQHPGIVAIHDAGQVEGRCYLVSDFVPGRTLAQLLAASRPPPREAA